MEQIASIAIPSKSARDQLNFNCQKCQSSASVFVCPCAFPPPLLCVLCFARHAKDRIEHGHATFPSHLYPHISHERNFDSMRKRLAHAIEIKLWLKDSIRKLEAAEEEVDAAIASVVKAMKKWEKRVRATLAQAQSQITTFLEQLEALIDVSITAESPEDLSSIERVSLETLPPLLTVTRSPLRLLEVLAPHVEICKVIPELLTSSASFPSVADSCVPFLTPAAVLLVSVPELLTTRIPLVNGALEVDSNSCWCFVDNDSIFECGGKNQGKSAALISVHSAFRTLLPDMSIERFMHCIVQVEREVFVFGGAGKADSTAEKFIRSSGCWVPLTGMSERRTGASATMITHAAQAISRPQVSSVRTIFIVGGARSNKIETFSIDSRTFAVLEVELPYRAWTLSVSLNSMIYIFTKDKCLSFDTLYDCYIMKTDPIPLSNWWSPAPAVLSKGLVFFLLGDSIHTFDPRTRGYLGVRIKGLA